MMYYGILVFLLLQVNYWEMFRCVSGMITFFGSRQKKAVLWPGTRIIHIGQGQNLWHILPAGADWMMQQKRMVVFNTLQEVIGGVYCPNPFLQERSRE